jgi:hypothetical protein
MHAIKSLLPVFLLLFMTGSHAQSRNIEGIDFPQKLSIHGAELGLNGGGLREKLGFLDLYVGALYLPQKSSDATEIVMSDTSMAIRIVIASGLVTRDRFIEALEEGFNNTSVGKYSPKDIQSFKEFLSDAFEPNDEILLSYGPEKGTILSKNGQVRGSFTGLPFKQALFAIWLGDKPAQNSLKQQMLGL